MHTADQQDIRFEHLVVFKDNQIYARAREQESRRVRLFLINENTGNVYSRNGRCGFWEELYGNARSFVISRIYSARQSRNIPVFNYKGAFSA